MTERLVDHHLLLKEGDLTSDQGMVIPQKSGEELARQALKRYAEKHSRSSYVTNLNVIAASLGPLEIDLVNLQNPGYLVDRGDGTGAILVRSQDRESKRWRFTAAHELGHWVADTVARRSGNPRRVTEDDLESWCDSFARELLVPREALRRFIEVDCDRKIPAALQRGPACFAVSAEVFENALSEHKRIVLAILARKSTKFNYHIARVRPTWIERKQSADLGPFLMNFAHTTWGNPLPSELLTTQGLGPLRLTLSGQARNVFYVALPDVNGR
jgi:Zn-dependent peptidase ImmA (M78 family)